MNPWRVWVDWLPEHLFAQFKFLYLDTWKADCMLKTKPRRPVRFSICAGERLAMAMGFAGKIDDPNMVSFGGEIADDGGIGVLHLYGW